MDQIRDFLTKVLTANSITKEIREEALLWRDAIDASKKKNVGVITDIGFNLRYPGTIDGDRDRTLSMKDITKCVQEVRLRRTDGRLAKISFIKEVRNFYGCNLKEAKELSEWLANQEVIQFDP
jgi:hypothetical protein